MKKTLLCLLPVWCFLQLPMRSQTLTPQGYAPNLSDYYFILWAPYSNTLIPTGTNQTWDFSSINFTLPPTTFYYKGMLYNDIPAVFPGAAFRWGASGNMEYINISNAGIELYGLIEPLTDTTKYTDPKKVLNYPLSYGNTYSDTWSYTRRVNSVTYTTTGTYSVSAVGTGTIITPDSKFLNVRLENALMLKIEENSTTYSANISNPTSTLSNVSYKWYVQDLHEAVVSIRKVYHNASSSFPSGARFIEVLKFPASFLSLNESSSGKSNIYPNPANKNFTVELPLNGGSAQLDIYDSQGKLIKSETTFTQSLKISTANWQPGIYFLRIASGEFVETKKMVVTH